MMNQALEIGDKAPLLSVPGLDSEMIEIGAELGDKSQLLFFLSPDCPVCNELTPVLKSAARAEDDSESARG